MNEAVTYAIAHGLALLQREAYTNAANKGFHDGDDRVRELDLEDLNHGLRIALIMGEGAEALDKIRAGATREEVMDELADIVIRVADFAQVLEGDLGEAVTKKMTYNKTRPPMHGKRF